MYLSGSPTPAQIKILKPFYTNRKIQTGTMSTVHLSERTPMKAQRETVFFASSQTDYEVRVTELSESRPTPVHIKNVIFYLYLTD